MSDLHSTPPSGAQHNSIDRTANIEGREQLPSLSNTNFIAHFHKFLLDLQHHADLILESKRPAQVFLTSIRDTIGTFIASNSDLQSRSGACKAGNLAEERAFIFAELDMLADFCPPTNHALRHFERKTVFQILNTLRSLANHRCQEMERLEQSDDNFDRQLKCTLAHQELNYEIRKGLERTILHTGSIDGTDNQIFQVNRVLSSTETQGILLSLQKIAHIVVVPQVNRVAQLCYQFGLDADINLETLPELQIFMNERFKELQPQALSLLEKLIVTRTREFLQRYCVEDQLYQRRVTLADPIEMLKFPFFDDHNIDIIPKIRREVVGDRDYGGLFDDDCYLKFGTCAKAWGLSAGSKPCNDLVDLVDIIRHTRRPRPFT